MRLRVKPVAGSGFPALELQSMSTLSLELLSSIIGDIYQCAANSSCWTATLGRIASALDTACTTIHVVNTATLQTQTVAHSPWDAEQLRARDETYGARGVPGFEHVIASQMDVPRSMLSHSNGNYSKSDFYKNWAQPQGLGDSCTMKFAENKAQICIIGTLARAGQGVICPERQRFMALLSPHLRRASLLGGIFGQTLATIKDYQAALDALSTPVLLLNGDRHVVYQNAASRFFLDGQSPFAIQNGTIVAKCPHLARSITEALGCAVTKKDEKLPAHDIMKSTVPFYARDTAYGTEKAMVATVVPLHAAKDQAITNQTAVAALFISMAGTRHPPPETVIATLFNLTPAEARIMLFVGNGTCVKVAATTTGLSVHTVKTHLANIYTKTGVFRQPELVKLLSDISTPIMQMPREAGAMA
jgi:DNA-binding CsgD family transcriptional regulator